MTCPQHWCGIYRRPLYVFRFLFEFIKAERLFIQLNLWSDEAADISDVVDTSPTCLLSIPFSISISLDTNHDAAPLCL